MALVNTPPPLGGGVFTGQRWGRGRLPNSDKDISDYLKQGGQTAGHRELWRFAEDAFQRDRRHR
jgi:hypothetical protein